MALFTMTNGINGVSPKNDCRKFKDESGNVYTLDYLAASYQDLKASGETEAETFEDYLTNCTDGNGTLTEVF